MLTRLTLALHIIFMVAWFAGLFYLPRLFVYHATAQDALGIARFKVMERRLYYGIMTPAALLTLFFGIGMLSTQWGYYLHANWMQAKLSLVGLLILFHIYCGWQVYLFKHDQNRRSDRFFRLLNEIPTLLLIAIVLLVTVQPF
jgi:putative membrane protein